MHKLTEIDLSDLQIGERLTIYRGSNAFLTGPSAAGYVGDAIVTSVKKKSAIIALYVDDVRSREYRLRFKDARICRIPNGEPTELYVHARGGRPTVTAYFTNSEYQLVKYLLAGEAAKPDTTRSHRWALTALARMEFHDNLRENGGRSA